ncbi:hypothetical protein QC762_600550 [Podospora pseudocomata]|uniref:ATP-dependent DNA helicase n=1 Tax=Podospora pseudocomata TaxID=2093779 RepID=A0ABR0G7P4_9PEZI|nr:hypothetical protein QC762_600550 [Podospora pseudocomata]
MSFLPLSNRILSFSSQTTVAIRTTAKHAQATREIHQSITMSRKRRASPDATHGRIGRPVPVEFDPWNRPLTPQASNAAEEWRRIRRQIDNVEDADLDSQHVIRLLTLAAEHRREYTRLAAGWKMLDHVLQPKSRTYEPLPLVQHDFLPEPDLYLDLFVDPSRNQAIKDCVSKYQQLKQSLDGFDPRSGAQWPIYELVEAERRRREYNSVVGSHVSVPPHQVPDEVSPQQLSSNSQEPQEPTPGPEPVLEERPPLCPEQEAVVKLAEQGRNIFYTGSAGCGKSTVLHEIKRRLKAKGKVVKVIAPTGLVALAINGSTTWTFMGWAPDFNKMPLDKLCGVTKANERVRKALRRVHTLIIDEISMVESNFFERMDSALRFVRKRDPEEDRHTGPDPASLPFGGIQLIVTGDFCQLPPIKPFKHCVTCGFELSTTKTCANRACRQSQFRLEDQFAFSSAAWQKCNFNYVHLKTIHRQRDEEFRALLEKCRTGIAFSQADIEILMNHESSTEDAVRLMPTREEVYETNERAFKKLPDPEFSYKCSDGRHIQENHQYLEYKYALEQNGDDRNHRVINFGDDNHRFEKVLKLKKDMSVLLLVNLNLREGLCNGSQGIIVDFESHSVGSLMRTLEGRPGLTYTQKEAIGTFASRNLNSEEPRMIALPVVRFQNGIERTILPECLVNEVGDPAPYSSVWRAQIPLMAGYALTIHKAQGMTLERVVINLENVFEDKQVYVALSRAKTLDGLKIEGDKESVKEVLERALQGDLQVQRFMEETQWIEFE